jgi:N-acetylmuramoyl-L-alanine amidase|tara:strand:+ start:17380 stop:17796 length:417 start_codon:yes stop_codon:yes gene_type:complete
MREINKIIIHCSATPRNKDFSAEDIRDWHVKGNGWDDIGYHFVVRLDGKIEYGRMVDKSGAHVKGHNRDSIGICYIGGMDKDMHEWVDTRTKLQSDSLVSLLKVLKRAHPESTIHGHRDFSTKACPSFDATNEYKNIC